jgi:hypothetical protein
MTAQKDRGSKGHKADNGRGPAPRGPAEPPRRKARDRRNAADPGAISPQELARLSEDPLFIDGLKQIAEVHMGGMPDHLVKLAAKLGAQLAIDYEALGARTGKKPARVKRR